MYVCREFQESQQTSTWEEEKNEDDTFHLHAYDAGACRHVTRSNFFPAIRKKRGGMEIGGNQASDVYPATVGELF